MTKLRAGAGAVIALISAEKLGAAQARARAYSIFAAWVSPSAFADPRAGLLNVMGDFLPVVCQRALQRHRQAGSRPPAQGPADQAVIRIVVADIDLFPGLGEFP